MSEGTILNYCWVSLYVAFKLPQTALKFSVMIKNVEHIELHTCSHFPAQPIMHPKIFMIMPV